MVQAEEKIEIFSFDAVVVVVAVTAIVILTFAIAFARLHDHCSYCSRQRSMILSPKKCAFLCDNLHTPCRRRHYPWAFEFTCKIIVKRSRTSSGTNPPSRPRQTWDSQRHSSSTAVQRCGWQKGPGCRAHAVKEGGIDPRCTHFRRFTGSCS